MQLEKQIGRLRTLLEASNVLNSALDIGEVLNNILRLMVDVVQAEAGTLWVVEEETDDIRAACAIGPSSDVILGIRLNRGEGIVGRAIASSKGHLVEDAAKDAAWASRVDSESGFVTRSMMTIPLTVKGTSIGAIQLLNKRNHRAETARGGVDAEADGGTGGGADGGNGRVDGQTNRVTEGVTNGYTDGGQHFTKDDFDLASALAVQSALALHNSQMFDEIYRMYVSIIRTLATTLDARDVYTAGHSDRVSKYSLQIARRMGLSPEDCNSLEIAALLHDIGKVGVPDSILLKPGRLTNEEFDKMKQHTVIGAEILSKIEPKRLMKKAIETARWHHERLDGSGYPDKLKADKLPLFARIVAVADSFDAMTTQRPYSSGRSFKEAMDELIRCQGWQYDEAVVHAFQEIFEEVGYEIDGRDRTVVPGDTGSGSETRGDHNALEATVEMAQGAVSPSETATGEKNV